MWLIDGNELKRLILEERDKIPYKLPGAVYEFGIPRRNPHGDSMRGGLRKALRCLERCTHIDADAVVGQAYWVSDDDDVLFHCSECGTQVSTSWDYEDLEWNYCPNCGKHMTAEPDVGDDWDSYMADRCYECGGYGDDYYTDENGELVSACDDCPYNGYSEDDWDDD